MSYSSDREREMFTATCGDCGNECQIPFKPKGDRPVYCRECFQNHKPEPRDGGRSEGYGENRGSSYGGNRGSSYGGNRGSSYGGNRGSSYGGNRGSSYGRRDDRPREMFDAKCGDCGNDCQIPFKPKEDRPVYCNECFQKHRNY